MYLFSHKTKTPISTYSESYRAPTSMKEVYKDPPLWAWEANKFLTPGLTHTMERHVDPKALQKMAKCALQDYSYRGSISGHPYLPEKYWFSQEEAEMRPCREEDFQGGLPEPMCTSLRAPTRNAVCCYNSPAVILPISEP
nr:spermatid-specific manchette-related protein 1 [Aotus nancymaae]